MAERLCTITGEQSTLMLTFSRKHPEDIFHWTVPEGIFGDWGFSLIAPAWYYVPGAKWQEEGNERFLEKDYPALGAFATEITVEDEYMECRIRVKNNRNYTVNGVGGHVCWGFQKAKRFYPDAMARTYIPIGGKLTKLSETDRSRSFENIMPVYAVKGAEGPENWRDRVDNGYGWGLSDDEVDNSFIGIESKDGTRVSGTFFKDAFKVTFNEKPIWHGCIHSEPYFGTLKAGEEKEVVGRAYIMKGTIKDLYKKFLEYKG